MRGAASSMRSNSRCRGTRSSCHCRAERQATLRLVPTPKTVNAILPVGVNGVLGPDPDAGRSF